MSMTAMDALMRQARIRPKSTALVFHQESWTYERLLAEAEALARGLAAEGVRPGDRVVLHMVNRPEMVVAYYACFRLGAIAAPLRAAFKFAELATLLQRLAPALYIGETALYPNVAAVETSILAADKRFVVGKTVEQSGRPWELLFDEAVGGALPEAPALHEPAVLLNTSGTTGQPKFVIHTAATLSETVDRILRHAGLCEDDVVVGALPMVHVGGLSTTLSFVAGGIPIILLEGFDADAVLDNIEHYRCTWCLGFPAQYAALLDRQRARPRNLASLRICLTAGDVCPVVLQDRCPVEIGAPLYNLWGATEVVGALTFGLQRGPVARIAEGARVRLVDERGVEVPRGEVGELLVRGPNVFTGYWNDPQATAELLKGGWYHTGDLMRRGEGHDLWFVGRKKDIIIRGGTNIAPAEVERVLTAHVAVQEAVVVGIPDEVLGQRVFGFVKLASGAEPAAVSDILAATAAQLADFKVPEGLGIVDDFPRNALSKVDRNALVTMAIDADRSLRGGAPLQPAQLPGQAARDVRLRSGASVN